MTRGWTYSRGNFLSPSHRANRNYECVLGRRGTNTGYRVSTCVVTDLISGLFGLCLRSGVCLSCSCHNSLFGNRTCSLFIRTDTT